MPEQAEPGLDWENLTGIKDALKSGSTVVISRTSLQENDTTIGVRVHSKKIRESVIHGINSYSEGALRDANKKLLIDSSERGTAPLLSDEPPTSESLLSWFMRQGGYIKLSMLPGGTDIVSIGFNLLVDSPLWNALRMSNFSPDINNVFDNSMMEAINSGIRNAREMIRQRHRGSQALDLLELFS